MAVMLIWIIGLGAVGASFMLVLAAQAVRHGHLSQTWWTRRRIERERRAAQRPIPTAAERVRTPRMPGPLRVGRHLADVASRRRTRPAEQAEAIPLTAATELVAPSASDRDLVSAAERQGDAALRGSHAVHELGSAERGDEVAARRRAAQQRIAAEAANSMALAVPGRIEDFLADELLDDLDLPAASSDR